MSAICTTCARPVGRAAVCPYCGDRVHAAWRRGASLALALSALTLLAVVWVRAGGCCRLGVVIDALPRHPDAALLTALAVALALAPCPRLRGLPGADTAEARRQVLAEHLIDLGWGIASLVGGALLPSPAASLPAAIALSMLLGFRLALAAPVYPLLAAPVLALAWRLAGV